MSRPKERRKARRRAERNMEQAWEALESGHASLAQRLSRRAHDQGAMNPRLCHDHGVILWRCGQIEEAEQALRAAISFAPGYGEALAALAALRMEQGRADSAVRLQRRVVELDPEDRLARERLATYVAVEDTEVPVSAEAPVEPVVLPTTRATRLDWPSIGPELQRHGAARLPGLLTPAECAALIELDEQPERFEHEVSLDDEGRGRLRYRFFRPPLPELVRSLRAEVYAPAAALVAEWNRQLGRREHFPAQHEAFLDECRAAGQLRSTPILLRYERGGFNAAHRDIAGRRVFPLQLAITLGPGSSEEDGGGEFELVDDARGRRRRVHRIATGVGDGVLFCTRERPVEIAGVWGLQPVMHAVAEVRSERRYALGLPFHDHA